MGILGLKFGSDKVQTTQNTSQAYDQREVNTDNSVWNDLSNRSVDNSVSNSYSSYDLSNRSVSSYEVENTNISSTSNAWEDASQTNSNNTTNADFSNRSTSSVWTDSSNRSTTNADFSDRSTNYSTTNTLDGGVIGGAFGFAKDAAGGAFDSLKNALQFATGVASGQQASVIHGYDYAGGIFDSALEALNKNGTRAYDAFDRAAKMNESALSLTGAAYADAKGTTQSQQKMIFAVLAVAAVAIVATRMRA